MKTRIYCISTASYESRVVGHVQGPDKPALSTLLKRFKAHYGYVHTVALKGHIDRSSEGILKGVLDAIDADAKCKSDGLTGYDRAEYFVSWLIRDHGFERAEVQEVSI